MVDPWLVALTAFLAACSASLGVIPVLLKGDLPGRLGWANALAAGLMMGAGYALLTRGIDLSPVGGLAGAVAGVVFVFGSHHLADLTRVDLSRPDDHSSASTREILWREVLHSAAEGVAIGVSFLVNPSMGILMAATMALHNVAEGSAISAALMARSTSALPAALASSAAMMSHVPAAVAAVLWIGPAGLSWGLGFAAGAMSYLVLVELLPESYRQRGHTGIAITASAAMGFVVLLHAVLIG